VPAGSAGLQAESDIAAAVAPNAAINARLEWGRRRMNKSTSSRVNGRSVMGHLLEN
jgi:hypothetical protein